MPKKKSNPKTERAAAPKRRAVESALARRAESDTEESEVREFRKAWKHPLKRELELVREIILAASPRIREGVKWNALSFRTTDHFATLNGPRHTDAVMIVLHTGAKAKGLGMRQAVDDPTGLLDWRGPERALVTFASIADIRTKRVALQGLLRSWLRAIASAS